MDSDPPRPISPLSGVEPWNWVADGYAEFTRPMLALYAEEALRDAALQPAHRVLDVAAGPGTATCLIAPHVAHVTAVDFAPEMVAHCRQHLANLGIANATVLCGDGQSLELESAAYDRVFSMFGLMFFPNRLAGFSELHRLLTPGGMALVTSWAPIAESPLMSAMFEALRAADPTLLPPQQDVGSLENPRIFEDEMRRSGFVDVTVRRVFKEWPWIDFEQFFGGMLRGSAPLEIMRRKVDDAEWKRRVAVMRAHLHRRLGPHPTGLGSTAWLARGSRAASDV